MKNQSRPEGKQAEDISGLIQRISDLENELALCTANNREMRAQEERYRNILDNMEEAYYEIDLNGNLTFFNTTAVKNLGYTDDVMMGLNFREYVDSDNNHKLVEAYSRVLRTGESIKALDWEIISKKSGTIPVESSITLMRNAQGRPSGFKGIIRDITRRRESEKALNESKDRLQREEERYRNILDNMEEAYYEVDLNGNLTFFNNTAVTNLGYTDSEMMGMNFRQYLDEDNKKKVFDIYTRVFRTGETVKGVDWELISKTGVHIPVESSISLIRDSRGRPSGFRGIIRDISARKQAEKALRDSEEKYRLLAQNASDIIVTMDASLRMTYVSPSVTRMRGYTVEEAMAQTPADMLAPSSLDYALGVFAEEMKIEETGTGDPDRVRLLELELKKKDGTTLWTEIAFAILRNDDKKFLGYLGIVHDITERKRAAEALLESEIKFRNLTETALDAIVTIDMEGVITYANPAVRELAGGRDITGLVLKDLLPWDFSEEQALIFEAVKQGFAEPLSYETKLTRQHDENPLYFDVRTSTLFTHGKPTGVLFVARDTTERRRNEEEIRMMAIGDPLTGLYNRRGFTTLAEQQIKYAARDKKKLLLFFIDLDGLKIINDTYGHKEGDRALKHTSVILKKTFRDSDIMARLAGDEFAVLVTDSQELPETALKRLKARTDEHNASSGLQYRISMSVGISDYNPDEPCTINELVSKADRLMYEQKKARKCSAG